MSLDHRADVAVFGECDSDNVGDLLIAEGVKQVLLRFGLESENLPLPPRTGGHLRRKADVRRATTARMVHRMLYRRVPRYTHAIDVLQRLRQKEEYSRVSAGAVAGRHLVVIGGGQLLSDRSLRMLMAVHALVEAANAEGVPVVMLGIGVSMPRTEASRWLFRRILQGVPPERVLVRDKASAEILESLTNRHGAYSFAPDCAVVRIRQLAHGAVERAKSGRIGLAPMGLGSLSPAVAKHGVNQDAWWLAVAQQFMRAGHRVVLFTTGVASDFDRCLHLQRILAGMELPIEVLDRPASTVELIDQVRSFDAVISQRLHCSVSIYGAGGVPLSLPWDRKVQSFFESIGLEDRVLEPDASPEDACERVFERRYGFDAPEDVELELMARMEVLLRPFTKRHRVAQLR